MTKQHNIKSLYYITHIDNVSSIIQHGILSHTFVEKRKVKFTPIYNTEIVTNRRNRLTPDGKSLWDFANLYFQPRNPMLYKVIRDADKKDIVIFGIVPSVLDKAGVFVSIGNAASLSSELLPAETGLKEIKKIWKVINSKWWTQEVGSKRKIMAESLVPDVVSPELIHTIYVANNDIVDRLKQKVQLKIPVVPEPNMFFQPKRRISVTSKLSLIEGDMFFSQMQTLTISVNTVGVMGKGLASRAKHQFPDVYVFYQDVCRQKKLQMGKPYLYKREASLDNQLADDPYSLQNPNDNKWFLLFPTKGHWRERSYIAGIEDGLKWVRDSYKQEGIKSLAVPALGCGLGGLKWREVGPLMCNYLSQIDIQVSIYLPREDELPDSVLSKKFLLG